MKLMSAQQIGQVSGGEQNNCTNNDTALQNINNKINVAIGAYVGTEMFVALATIATVKQADLRNFYIIGYVARTAGAVLFGLTTAALFNS